MTTRANLVELERALTMISGLSNDTPMSELRALAKAALGDSRPRTPAERAYHVVLRMIRQAPENITPRGAIETVKTVLLVVKQNSNSVIQAWAETYERRIATIPIEPEAVLRNSSFETCLTLAIQRGWPLPHSEPEDEQAEMPIRGYWLRVLQRENAEAAGLHVPPIGPPPFRTSGALAIGSRLTVRR